MQDELVFFQSWWKILRKYWNPPAQYDQSKEANEFWVGLVEECRSLMKKYDHNELFGPFARKMCFELMFEVQRRSDELHKGEEC